MVARHCLARRHGGFTLIEVTVVMSLIVILSTIAVAGYRNAITRSREAVLKHDLFQMRDAIDQYYIDKEQYPSALEALVTDGYLRAMPIDPFTNSTETWEQILAELDPNDPLVQGVFDVRTTYEETALDGTVYADW